MTISQSLNHALSGLTVTSRRAEIASSNIANALTEGYGRRTVEVSATALTGTSGGVRVDAVHREVNPVILADRRVADGSTSFAQQKMTTLNRIETAFGAVDDPDSLTARLVNVEVALTAATSDPSSEVALSTVVTRLSELTGAIGRIAGTIQTERAQADSEIATSVDILNTATQQVVDLNRAIQRALSQGGDAAGLMDQRQTVIDKISSIVPVREVARDNGAVALWTISGGQLVDGPAVRIEFEPHAVITPDMSLSGGGLSGLSINGLAQADGYGRLAGGSLAAQFQLRDTTLVEQQRALDNVAVDLVTRFSDPAVDPSLASGQAGALTDGGGPFVAGDQVGLSLRLRLNSAIDPALGNDPTALRNGIAATTPTESGDARQLQRYLSSLSEQRATEVGGQRQSVFARIAEVGETLSTERLMAEQELAFASARRDTLSAAEQARGVDTDVELQNMLLIEQAYAANAKVMQALDEMMKRLMEI